jgi:hypothetical protein
MAGEKTTQALLVFFRTCADLFSATAARMSAFNAFSSVMSPSRISMAYDSAPIELDRLVRNFTSSSRRR